MLAQESPNRSPGRVRRSRLMAGRNQAKARAVKRPSPPFPAVCLASTRMVAVVMEEVAQDAAAAPSAAGGPPSLVLPHSAAARWRSRLRSHPRWGLAAAGLAIVVAGIAVVLVRQGDDSAAVRSPANGSVPPLPAAVTATPALLEEPPAAPAVAAAEAADSAAVAEPPTAPPPSPAADEADEGTTPAATLPPRPADQGADEPTEAPAPPADAEAAVTVSALRAPLDTWPQIVEWVVRKGEILTDIAQRHHTVMLAIVALNGLADPNAIAPGQRLLIPQGFSPTEGSGGSAPGWLDQLLTWRDLKKRVVRAGESLRDIATEYVTTVEALQVLNALDAEERVRPGRLLLIPFGFSERPHVSASVN